MRAKLIETGEIVNVMLTKQGEECGTNVYQEIGTTKNCSVCRKFLDSELEFVGDFSSNTYTTPKKIDWEQRRFELVKAAMPFAMQIPQAVEVSFGNYADWIAKTSIRYADAVIAKLKDNQV